MTKHNRKPKSSTRKSSRKGGALKTRSNRSAALRQQFTHFVQKKNQDDENNEPLPVVLEDDEDSVVEPEGVLYEEDEDEEEEEEDEADVALVCNPNKGVFEEAFAKEYRRRQVNTVKDIPRLNARLQHHYERLEWCNETKEDCMREQWYSEAARKINETFIQKIEGWIQEYNGQIKAIEKVLLELELEKLEEEARDQARLERIEPFVQAVVEQLARLGTLDSLCKAFVNKIPFRIPL